MAYSLDGDIIRLEDVEQMYTSLRENKEMGLQILHCFKEETDTPDLGLISLKKLRCCLSCEDIRVSVPEFALICLVTLNDDCDILGFLDIESVFHGNMRKLITYVRFAESLACKDIPNERDKSMLRLYRSALATMMGSGWKRAYNF